MLYSLKGSHLLTQLDLSSWFHHLKISGKGRHKIVLRKSDEVLYKVFRAGFGLAVLALFPSELLIACSAHHTLMW